MQPRNRRLTPNTTLYIAQTRILMGLAVCVMPLPAASQGTNIDIGSGTRITLPVKSMKALRDAGLIKQKFDYSCGAAALATILRYGFGQPVSEKTVLSKLFDLLTSEEKKTSRKDGFSLYDLQRVAQKFGYRAQGFRLDARFLPRLSGPVIVFIEPRGYKHFAVLRGVRGDRVYLADPSRGNIRWPVHKFLDSWQQKDGKGIIFVIEPMASNKTATKSPKNSLTLSRNGLPQPEIMTVREMLAVGNPFVRLPELLR